ncbi:heme-thiolate peroxidase [Candolleomyces aberdarensis]|uniref:Heme-thiolate peroxidase n=1 Tax=Candolleomyces aberdarensis TaxID=2316362 RepID=A0A4Q2DB21_9AGAR|nr:heme-thiolate peroxidase [Candolleomyces aberdarensis]
MIPKLFACLTTLLFVFGALSTSLAFPNNVDLPKRQEIDDASAQTGGVPGPVNPPPPPGPPSFTGTKLVNDRAHPWRPLRDGDERGPCPGMNTLASHGYISRDGVATPGQIVTSVQEGFNMENKFAIFVTYLAHLMNGNLVTDLLSIGGKTRKTGPDPPPPAHAGGFNVHGTFEGDAGMTRGDAFFGDNHSFNQTLFDKFVDFSNRYGDGYYNLTVAGELRFQRLQDSIATNPQFSFKNVRFFTAYGESAFPINFFVDGRKTDKKLDMASALSIFRDMRYPPDFFRPPTPMSNQGIAEIFAMHPFQPGGNADGKVNNFVVDPTSADFTKPCVLYDDILNTVKTLYPNPTGVLRRNLIKNLRYFYTSVPTVFGTDCGEQFPYGQG